LHEREEKWLLNMFFQRIMIVTKYKVKMPHVFLTELQFYINYRAVQFLATVNIQ